MITAYRFYNEQIITGLANMKPLNRDERTLLVTLTGVLEVLLHSL